MIINIAELHKGYTNEDSFNALGGVSQADEYDAVTQRITARLDDSLSRGVWPHGPADEDVLRRRGGTPISLELHLPNEVSKYRGILFVARVIANGDAGIAFTSTMQAVVRSAETDELMGAPTMFTKDPASLSEHDIMRIAEIELPRDSVRSITELNLEVTSGHNNV